MFKKIFACFAWLLTSVALAQTVPVQALFHQPNNPTAGNPQGNVTVAEFFDYQCGHCQAMAPIISAIIKANPNVRVVFKDFPVFPGQTSTFAARAALAANLQGKYYQFSHALLSSDQPLTEQTVLNIAQQTGLNTAKLKSDMRLKNIYEQLRANIRLAKQLKLVGTPAFFIGKTNGTGKIAFVFGEMTQSELQTAIDNAGK